MAQSQESMHLRKMMVSNVSGSNSARRWRVSCNKTTSFPIFFSFFLTSKRIYNYTGNEEQRVHVWCPFQAEGASSPSYNSPPHFLTEIAASTEVALHANAKATAACSSMNGWRSNLGRHRRKRPWENFSCRIIFFLHSLSPLALTCTKVKWKGLKDDAGIAALVGLKKETNKPTRSKKTTGHRPLQLSAPSSLARLSGFLSSSSRPPPTGAPVSKFQSTIIQSVSFNI